jgi:iron complex outermembrane receptor protein
LTFTLRDDGTSRFSKDNRWGLFPSVALGWKIVNLPFMESVRENMNEFKLRLGWGITGQQSVGGYFPYYPTYTQSSNVGSYYPNMYTGTYVDANGNVISNTYYPNVYNPDLKWEETTTWNVGFDLGWWNNRLTVALDWYLRNSKDLLSYVTVAPGATTSNMMDQNIGTLRNLGLEATIAAKPVMTDDFTWDTSFNVAWNKNEITKLNNTNDPNSYVTTGSISGGTGNTVQAHKVGYPAYSYFLYEQVYDEYGMPIEGCYVDQNGDGTIDDNDRVIRHSKDPKVTMSWNNTFSYKNWDFGFQLRASIGNYVYNDVASTHSTLSATYNTSGVHNLIKTDYYFQGGQTTNTYLSDYWLRNAGFVRCDNITLGYTWTNLINDQLRLRLYGAVQNPFVITKYNGLDPEVFGGIDNNIYPRPVTFTVGVVATF